MGVWGCGRHPYSHTPTLIMPGEYFDDLSVGEHIRHSLGRTITEADNTLLCAITLNTQPLHINSAISQTAGGRIIKA